MASPHILTAAENVDKVAMDETLGPGIEGVCLYVPLWTAVFYILNFSKTDAHIPRISTNTNP